MASIIVRGLNVEVKERLVLQAQKHGRSMEAEVRDILTRATSQTNIGIALAEAAKNAGGVDDFPVPDRKEIARTIEFE